MLERARRRRHVGRDAASDTRLPQRSRTLSTDQLAPLVTGLDLATARLVVASLDVDELLVGRTEHEVVPWLTPMPMPDSPLTAVAPGWALAGLAILGAAGRGSLAMLDGALAARAGRVRRRDGRARPAVRRGGPAAAAATPDDRRGGHPAVAHRRRGPAGDRRADGDGRAAGGVDDLRPRRRRRVVQRHGRDGLGAGVADRVGRELGVLPGRRLPVPGARRWATSCR